MGGSLQPTQDALEPYLALAHEMWRCFPDTFAERASVGKWRAHRWLQALSELITPQIIRGGARILVSAPPQHGKSEFFSHWLPTWYLNQFKGGKVILGTYAQRYADRWGAKVRLNLVSNPFAAVPMRRDTLSKQRFITQDGGQMICAGVDGQMTGEGADLFIVDDPYKNIQEALSPIQRENVLTWFRSVATTRLSEHGSIVIMHTRWTDNDLIGTLAQEEGWTYINLEAICEHPEKDLLGRQKGEALCPERYSAESLTRIRREVTDLFWFPMYQGSAVDVAGAIIKLEDLQYYDESPADMAKGMEEIAIFADLTYDKTEESDFAVFEAWGRKGPNIYLLHQIRAQMGITEQMQALKDIVVKYPTAFHKEIEKKANGAAVITLAEGTIPGLKANNPQTSKGARLAAVSPLYKSKNIYYPNPEKPGNAWVKVNVYEIVRMTLSGTKADHDDTVDVASMAVAHLGRMASTLKRLAALSKR